MVNFPKFFSKPSGTLLVTEEDETTFAITHPKHLPLFASPLAAEREREQHDALVKEGRANNEPKTGFMSIDSDFQDKSEIRDLSEPVLRTAHESSTIQLFYDLFFVANLTTFTKVHEIDDGETLKSYVGFFGILWFTWFQVALFDVRFSNDSAVERLGKALQFGVMTGFAVVGPGYSTGWEAGTPEGDASLQTFQTLSMILFASRIVLAAQYATTLYWLKDYKKALAPILFHIGALLIAAWIYFGLYFSFRSDSNGNGLIAWYITLGFEAITILLVSGRTKFLSFRRTGLTERLGLLTLIILGEGIIGMCSSIRKVGTDRNFSPDVIGMIICSVGIIYFLWMLYFDQTEAERVGTIRQQIWAVLHFPFHVCVLLVVEGLSRLSVYRKILNIVGPFQDALYQDFSSFNDANSIDTVTHEMLTNFVQKVNGTLNELYDKFSGSTIALPNLKPYYQQIENIDPKDSNANSTFLDNYYNIAAGGVNWVCINFGVEAPKSSEKKGSGSEVDVSSGIADLFNTVFTYFFIASGLTLIFLGLLLWFGKRRKLRGEVLAIFVRFFVGLGLAFLTLMMLPQFLKPDSNDSYDNYLSSPWMLPTVLLCYGFVIIIDHVLINYVRIVVHHRRGNVDA